MDLNDIQERIIQLSDKEIIDTLKLGENELQPGVFTLYQSEAEKRGIDPATIQVVGYKKFLYANIGMRFINLIIDYYGIYFLSFGIFFFPIRLEILSPGIALILTYIFFFFYFVICEYRYNKTIGKFITKTTIRMLDGTKPLLKAIIIRTVSRLIPFNNLVTFFSGISIHDRLSQTRCYNDKDIKMIDEISIV